MNTNQTLFVLVLAVVLGTATLVAYGLRYEPIGGDGINNPVLVWDRWEREVCQVSLIAGTPVACSRTRPFKDQ